MSIIEASHFLAATLPRLTENDVLRCRDVSEKATDYLEGALPPRQWLAMRWHLLLCGMCRAYLDQLRKTARLLGMRRLPPPSAEVERQLLAAAATPPEPPGDRSGRD